MRSGLPCGPSPPIARATMLITTLALKRSVVTLVRPGSASPSRRARPPLGIPRIESPQAGQTEALLCTRVRHSRHMRVRERTPRSRFSQAARRSWSARRQVCFFHSQREPRAPRAASTAIAPSSAADRTLPQSLKGRSSPEHEYDRGRLPGRRASPFAGPPTSDLRVAPRSRFCNPSDESAPPRGFGLAPRISSRHTMHMSDLRRAARAALLLLATSGGPGAWSAPAIPADDPAAGAAQQRDLVKRLEERLKLDGEAIRRYSYVESTVLEKRAADGTLRSSVTEVNEITYRDGRRLKRRLADDLEQDSDGFAIMRSEESRFGATPAPLQEAKEGPFAMEQLIPCFHFYPMGQERVEGRPALRIAFTPIAGCLQDDSRSGRILGRLAGTLWVDEEAHDLVRVRGYLEEPVSFGFGLLGKVDGFDL